MKWLFLLLLAPTVAFSKVDYGDLKKQAQKIRPSAELTRVGVAAPSERHKPSWKKKRAVYNRIKNKRHIYVTANTPQKKLGEEKKYVMELAAAAHVEAPFTHVARQAWNFENLQKSNPIVKEVKFFKKINHLYIHLAILGYDAKMLMKLQKKTNKGVEEIHWNIIDGDYKTMKGVVRLTDVGTNRTEVSLYGDFISRVLPAPAPVLKSGLAIFGKTVAIALRSKWERGYQQIAKASN